MVIYSGIFCNFILKEWLVHTGDILKEDCKYRICLNAERLNEQPLYVNLMNHGKKRIIEVSIKAFKAYS